MKVSVAMITYNHEAFVAQAIESVLMQKTDFDFELVIGDDCSTDKTRGVITEFTNRYPDKIRLLLPERNLGMNKNFAQTLFACKGQYIALLEGDDYWTSIDKLQRQVDLLDANSNCAICFHNVLGFYDDGSKPSWCVVNSEQKLASTLEDLLEGWCPPTCSAILRGSLLSELPTWYYSASVGEWPLYISLMLKTPNSTIKYIDEIMANYRVHDGGIWSPLNQLNRAERLYQVCKTLSPWIDNLQRKHLQVSIVRCWFNFAVAHEQNGDEAKANDYLDRVRRSSLWHVKRALSDTSTSYPQMLRLSIIVYASSLYRLMKALKQSLRGGSESLV
jgi:glycosyltransferase involved in cell wall biosynthesis